LQFSIQKINKKVLQQTLDSELDPDPQIGKMLDWDTHIKINADPQPCQMMLYISASRKE
jgi:hypothetical protein